MFDPPHSSLIGVLYHDPDVGGADAVVRDVYSVVVGSWCREWTHVCIQESVVSHESGREHRCEGILHREV